MVRICYENIDLLTRYTLMFFLSLAELFILIYTHGVRWFVQVM